MIFRRRDPATLSERMRVALWPRHSWSRSAAYAGKRVLRLPATPHAIAAGVAAGVFASFTPFMGLHIFIALGLAWIFSGNMIASALGTLVGNPLTFPAIWTATYWTGSLLLAGAPEAAQPVAGAAELLLVADGATPSPGFWGPLVGPMAAGGVVLGMAAALLFYFPTRRLVAGFQQARAARIAAAAAMRRPSASFRS